MSEHITPGQCNRPTKAGTPCQISAHHNLIPWPGKVDTETMQELLQLVGGPPCGVHRKQDDPEQIKLRELLTRAFAQVAKTAEEYGRETGETSARLQIEHRQREEARKAREDANYRKTDHAGRPIIRCGNYAYIWPYPEQPQVGDKVLLPANYVSGGPTPDIVTALGTSYTGHLRTILGRG